MDFLTAGIIIKMNYRQLTAAFGLASLALISGARGQGTLEGRVGSPPELTQTADGYNFKEIYRRINWINEDYGASKEGKTYALGDIGVLSKLYEIAKQLDRRFGFGLESSATENLIISAEGGVIRIKYWRVQQPLLEDEVTITISEKDIAIKTIEDLKTGYKGTEIYFTTPLSSK